jgi:putative transposase
VKEHQAEMKTADLGRKYGISEASFYNWKAKHGGLEVSEAKRLRGLKSENGKLKKLLADAMLDNAALKHLSWCIPRDVRCWLGPTSQVR